MASRDEIVTYLNERLCIDRIEDYSVNGLQVQGKNEIKKIAVATDAAISVYEKAKAEGCDMIVTHHGLIWKGIRTVTGRDYQHIKLLLDNDINLYAAHIPLDLHPEIGNNIKLAEMAGLNDIEPFGEYHGNMIGCMGTLPKPKTIEELAAFYKEKLGGEPKLLSFGPKKISTVAIVSGGGGSMLAEAADKKLDCYVTGEGSHPNYHHALESSLNVLYIGHYNSETIGVQTVGDELAAKFNVESIFIDEPTTF